MALISAKKINAALENFARGIDLVIPPYMNTIPHMTFELSRSRRYQHELSIAVLQFQPGQATRLLQDNKRAFPGWRNTHVAGKLLFTLAGAILRRNLRDSDILTQDISNDCFIVLFTETSSKAAAHAAGRLNDLLHRQMHLTLEVGIAEFPEDGFTVADLVEFAKRNLKSGFHVESASNGKSEDGNKKRVQSPKEVESLGEI